VTWEISVHWCEIKKRKRRGGEGRGEERRGNGDGLSEFKIRFVVMQ
jgi:hypothetical protein